MDLVDKDIILRYHMSRKLIKSLGNPILREITPEITEITDKEILIIGKLKLALATINGYAIAANQMGFNSRIFVHNFNKKYEAIINPRLADYENEYWLFNEGCLSIPEFYFPIWRPRKVLLRGLDVNGNDVRIETTDLLARIFQHEVDHLNGFLVIDRLDPYDLEVFHKQWKIKNMKSNSKTCGRSKRRNS